MLYARRPLPTAPPFDFAYFSLVGAVDVCFSGVPFARVLCPSSFPRVMGSPLCLLIPFCVSVGSFLPSYLPVFVRSFVCSGDSAPIAWRKHLASMWNGTGNVLPLGPMRTRSDGAGSGASAFLLAGEDDENYLALVLVFSEAGASTGDAGRRDTVVVVLCPLAADATHWDDDGPLRLAALIDGPRVLVAGYPVVPSGEPAAVVYATWSDESTWFCVDMSGVVGVECCVAIGDGLFPGGAAAASAAFEALSAAPRCARQLLFGPGNLPGVNGSCFLPPAGVRSAAVGDPRVTSVGTLMVGSPAGGNSTLHVVYPGVSRQARWTIDVRKRPNLFDTALFLPLLLFLENALGDRDAIVGATLTDEAVRKDGVLRAVIAPTTAVDAAAALPNTTFADGGFSVRLVLDVLDASDDVEARLVLASLPVGRFPQVRKTVIASPCSPGTKFRETTTATQYTQTGPSSTLTNVAPRMSGACVLRTYIHCAFVVKELCKPMHQTVRSMEHDGRFTYSAFSFLVCTAAAEAGFSPIMSSRNETALFAQLYAAYVGGWSALECEAKLKAMRWESSYELAAPPPNVCARMKVQQEKQSFLHERALRSTAGSTLPAAASVELRICAGQLCPAALLPENWPLPATCAEACFSEQTQLAIAARKASADGALPDNLGCSPGTLYACDDGGPWRCRACAAARGRSFDGASASVRDLGRGTRCACFQAL